MAEEKTLSDKIIRKYEGKAYSNKLRVGDVREAVKKLVKKFWETEFHPNKSAVLEFEELIKEVFGEELTR